MYNSTFRDSENVMFLRDIGLVDRSRIEIEDVSDDISESSKVKSTGEILKFN